MRLYTVLSLLPALLASGAAAQSPTDQWTVSSPDGGLRATVALAQGKLQYRIDHRGAAAEAVVLPWSPLGVVRSDGSFAAGLRFRGAGRVADLDETYKMPHGKRSECRHRARQQTFTFENAQGAVVEIDFRVADDGAAFRYRFPGKSEGPVKVTAELTGFQLPAGAKAWTTPYSEAGQYTPAYEEYYLEVPAGTDSPKKPGWAFPALFRTADRWLLVTEAATDGAYCGCRLDQKAAGGLYRVRFPDAAEGWGQGEVEPSRRLPWTLPWRVLVVGQSLATIVESTLVTDLNPPSRVADTAWIKPGRAAWSWWSDHDSPRDFRKLREFVDLAAEMGWEYFLVDANWTLMDHGNVRELADYARQKNVALLLWYNSGGEHNVVTEKPRGAMKAPEVRKFEFELLKKWGVAGVKIDFFQSDKQNILALYHDILRDAAAHRMMINFHGCTVPRGWERTWPHLMTMEGVRGEECYTFASEYPQEAPRYNTIVPFTRNAVGPMDYTPCAFSDDRYPHLTTNAHELALPVVFESAWLHFADRVSAYRELPPEPKALLRDIPVTWDETRFVAGEPGKYVVLARRKGKVWHLGAINGQKAPLDLKVPVEFLGPGTYEGTLIADGDGPRKFASRKVALEAKDTLELSLLPYGGAVVGVKRRGD